MDEQIRSSLFISYSHSDKIYMHAFRKHLQGMLFGRSEIWCDEDVPAGTPWENKLETHLNHANAALLLVTPDYLVSQWCRRELSRIDQAYGGNRIGKAFWVQVKPCGWRGTELAKFQSWDFNIAEALTEFCDDIARERAILKICEEVAAEMNLMTVDVNPKLTFVRRLLLDTHDQRDRGLFAEKFITDGDFAIVCRGRFGDSLDVALKVLLNHPLREHMVEKFLEVARARKEIDDQCFVRTLDFVQTKAEKHVILISEFVECQDLATALREGKKFSVDDVATLLRRAASALQKLHSARKDWKPTTPEDEVPHAIWRYGFLTSHNTFYDERWKRLRMPLMSVSSFLLQQPAAKRFGNLSDSKITDYAAPEQISKGEHSEKGDQYMLGQIALEMLEGCCVPEIKSRAAERQRQASESDFTARVDVWRGTRPDITAGVQGKWAETHPQLQNIIRRMLAEDPDERWGSMEEIVERLSQLEDMNRALAKHGYQAFVEGRGDEFAEQFYDRFFLRSPGSKRRFKDIDPKEQNHKLMMSMDAVLNYHRGNDPTALNRYVRMHKVKKGEQPISENEFDLFRDCFLETLDEFTNRNEEIREAWRRLFEPAVEFFKTKCAGRFAE